MTSADAPRNSDNIAFPNLEEGSTRYKMTPLGNLVIKALDYVRLQRLRERCGRYPVEVSTHLSSRYSADGTVTLSPAESREMLVPFSGPDMPPIVEEVVEPAIPKVISSDMSGTIPLHETNP